MFKSIFHVFLLCMTVASPAWGQLHLLAGSPHEKYNETYAASLFRVEDDGAVKPVSELVAKSPGAWWISIAYDLRKAVVETGYPGNAIMVVDFDKAAVVKKCAESPDPGGRRGFGEQWLSNPPAFGPSFEWIAASADPKDAVVRGMLLDPAVSCKDSFANRPAEEVRFALKDGKAGIGDVVFNMGLDITIQDAQSEVDYGRAYAFVGKHIPLDYVVPRDLLASIHWLSYLEFNDSHVLCITLAPPGGYRSYRVLVFRKSDKTWHVLRTPSEIGPDLRGFGRYIAVTEKNEMSPKNPKSAGSEKWRKGKRTMGPELAERMDSPEDRMVYPGKLHIYDVETEKLFPLTTDQADSEVLLVENGLVYYRVLNQLYQAPISDRGIGPARLLATDDAILDAHWAFLKR
jgi:hypothetical protein